MHNKELKNLARIRNIIDYIEKHFTEVITLEDVATYVGLNPEYFCRYFKKQMGVSLIEYVNLIRLTHIYHDLRSTNESISSLQEKYGFTNYKVFNRMFKQVYGTTPSKMRLS